FAAVRAEQRVPAAFPPEVEMAAAEAARRATWADRRDARDLALVTIDPLGSLDLDQALLVEARSAGWRVWYAIADVAAWVDAGGPVDAEARHRGVTLYSPDGRTPLHPPVLCERAASLLPDGDRPALLWRIDVDEMGATIGDPSVERAVVRSRAQLDYPAVQAQLDAGTADDHVVALRDVGEARFAQERARGAVSLELPEQQVEHDAGRYRLGYRRSLRIEAWNAQISLLTGMEAAGLMVAANVGILRTLPPPDLRTLAAIRRSARALGVAATPTTDYADVVRAADPATDAGAALLHQAARALRGAGYLVLDRGPQPSARELVHSAIAAPYAHVTAPLRRLADRFANEVVVAVCAGTPVPAWATDALPSLPKIMGASHDRDGELSRALVDAVEALVLRDRVGEVFLAAVTNVDERGGVVQLRDPAVLARVDGVDEARLGREVSVRLDAVDVAARKVTFTLVQPNSMQ
ncbi:MAG: RNB domain-containing ribonuclease, partial [Acidimicrobiales bacterium]